MPTNKSRELLIKIVNDPKFCCTIFRQLIVYIDKCILQLISLFALIITSGSLSGVQNGLQSAMDLLKFILVISLPGANTFGILIILSFLVSQIYA